MKRIIEYPITNFYIGELYLYTKFGNLLTGEGYQEPKKRLEIMQSSDAINFQEDLESRYIDWDNTREYTGFLTIFYKQDNKYICLHDGKIYQLNKPNIIDNLVLLSDLLPKIERKIKSRISMYEALELFDVLFKEKNTSSILYQENPKPITNFIVGDISLRERTENNLSDKRIEYINLPHHIMLEKENLILNSYSDLNYINTVYRCLFLTDGIDLYNLHNHQIYNRHEDVFQNITTLKEYLNDFDIYPKQDKISIPKALKLFKRTI